MRFGNVNACLFDFRINLPPLDLHRVQDVRDQVFNFVLPQGDVHLISQRRHDAFDSFTSSTDAGPDGVNRVVVGNHGNLGTAAGIAGHGLDLDDAVIDFRHFLREQRAHELAGGA